MIKKLTFKTKCLHASLFVAMVGEMKAEAAPLPLPFLLAQGEVARGFGSILYIIATVGFVMGVISVIAGAKAIDRGEEGKMKIVGGIMTAMAVPIMRAIYSVLLPGSGADTIQITPF